LNYGNKTVGGGALLVSTGIGIWKTWVLAVILIVAAITVMVVRNKRSKIRGGSK
jgi:hypothetical protein